MSFNCKNKKYLVFLLIFLVPARYSSALFADAGPNRVYTEIIFKNDEMIMKVYTNKYNTLKEPELHMNWNAKLSDRIPAADAIDYFNYPQKPL